jgi:serine/threonine-protein kinase
MRWNPFRRAGSAAVDSRFETTVVDDAAAARLAAARTDGASGARAPAPAPARSPTTFAEAPSIGHIGRYALKTVLGVGGLGTVYAAWDPLLSRMVAVKTLHLDADPAARESLDALFLNEARAAAGLSHPHIVTVFDAGPAETGVYIAMERLQGQDLRHLMQQGQRPNPIDAAQIVRRVADALAYAHRKGVIHCDIKPANIFMVGRTHPKVLDFGIARIAHREAMPSLEGMVAGSPYYLAPEQLDGHAVDRRSDVYALGVVLYELLAGHKPFDGQTIEEIQAAVRRGDPAPAHRAFSRVPPGLSAIAAQSMARDPDQRYPSARHLSMELRHWIESPEARALIAGARKGGLRGALRRAAPMAWSLVAGVSLSMAALAWWWQATTGDRERAVASLGVGRKTAPAGAGAASTPGLGGARTTPAAVDGARVAAGARTPDGAATSLVATLAGTSNSPAGASTGTADSAAATVADGAAAPASTPVLQAGAAAEKASAATSARARRKAAAASGAEPAVLAAGPALGVVQLALIPWGQVEVDGQPMGTSPPLTRLTLTAGAHTVTVSNADFPPYSTTLHVDGENPVTLRHRFGP